MRKGERRISHLQTRHSASSRGDFANLLQAGEQKLTMENAPGFTPTVPAWWCPAGWQEQALLSFFSAYCHQEVLNMHMSHPRKMYSCMTQNRNCFCERKKTTIQTGKETSNLGQESKLFPLNAFPISDLSLFDYHKRNLKSVFTDSWINANLQLGSYLHTSHFYQCIWDLSTLATCSESTVKSQNTWEDTAYFNRSVKTDQPKCFLILYFIFLLIIGLMDVVPSNFIRGFCYAWLQPENLLQAFLGPIR